jgi:hypothetical protein
MVGAHGLEPWTSSLSGTRSSQLSYAPVYLFIVFIWNALCEPANRYISDLIR